MMLRRIHNSCLRPHDFGAACHGCARSWGEFLDFALAHRTNGSAIRSKADPGDPC
jgi:hypothetical protein